MTMNNKVKHRWEGAYTDEWTGRKYEKAKTNGRLRYLAGRAIAVRSSLSLSSFSKTDDNRKELPNSFTIGATYSLRSAGWLILIVVVPCRRSRLSCRQGTAIDFRF